MNIQFIHLLLTGIFLCPIPILANHKIKGIRICTPGICDCDKPDTIDCDGENLKTVAIDPITGAHRVVVLSMISNKITQIRHQEILMGKGDRLNRLLLSKNLIEKIDDGAFNSTPALTDLDLSNNKLTNLSELTFAGLLNLMSLRLDHNQIEDFSNCRSVFAGMPQLRYLSIDWTPIKRVSNETFLGLSSLVELSIDHSELTYFPIDTLKPLSRLETLSLRHNRFHVLPLDELRWLSQLKHVDFSGNPILTINSNSFRHNTHLRTLAFINMPELTDVEDCAFCNLYELRTLQIINASKFTDFDPEAFGRDTIYFQTLETIDLVNNSLSTLDEEMLPWENVTSLIRLSGNPWHCDCELLWMMSKNLKLDQAKQPVCDSPSPLKGKSIESLRDYDPGFCLFTRLSAKFRTARLFLIVAVLLVVFAIIATSWYLFAKRSRNGLKLRNLFYKPQMPKYAYRNLAMGDDVEQDSSRVVVNDASIILPKGGNRANRDLASRLAEDV